MALSLRLSDPRLDLLLSRIRELLVANARSLQFFPYYVLAAATPIPFDSAVLCAKQIFGSFHALHTAFTNPAASEDSRRAALEAFHALGPAPPSPPSPLLLVAEPPAWSPLVLRLSVLSVFNFVQLLRTDNFPNGAIQIALAEALRHVHKCNIDYSHPDDADIPPVVATMTAAPLMIFNATLPQFSGDILEDVSEFITSIERILEASTGTTAAQKLAWLEGRCQGPALSLVRRDLARYAAENKDAATQYVDIKASLTAAFPPQQDPQRFRDALETRVKTDSESFPQYVQSVLALCEKANVKDPAEQLRNLHRGLPLHIASSLRPSDYTDVPSFVAQVSAYDALHKGVIRRHAQHALETATPEQRLRALGAAAPTPSPPSPPSPPLLPLPPSPPSPPTLPSEAPAPASVPAFASKLTHEQLASLISTLEGLLLPAPLSINYARGGTRSSPPSPRLPKRTADQRRYYPEESPARCWTPRSEPPADYGSGDSASDGQWSESSDGQWSASESSDGPTSDNNSNCDYGDGPWYSPRCNYCDGWHFDDECILTYSVPKN